MGAILRAFRAEAVKLRRTLALWLAMIVPAAILLLYFILYSRPSGAGLLSGRDAWLWITQNALILWSMIMLPMFAGLEAALLAGLEHRSQGWKHLFALPLPRSSIYLAKLLVATLLIGLSMASMFVWIYLTGKAIGLVNPQVGFERAFPLLPIAVLILAVYLGSLFMISIYVWIATGWQSFVAPIAVAIVSVFLTLIISQTNFWWLFPWALPGNVENAIFASFAEPGNAYPLNFTAWRALAISVGGYALVALIGCRNVVRRDVL
ncbi:MAG: ABC transporter permease [Anaerolineales bacterium]|jgi:hypothetical protein